ncbi:MAG: hypothetical protein ACKVS8_10560 [Phycisphaerales bacterium]
MTTYPTSPRSDFLTWAHAHVAVFDTQEGAIGISSQQAAAFQAATAAAASAHAAQAAAFNAYKASIAAADAAFADLRRSASLTTKVIRTFAQTSGNPGVYSLARIPPPATASVAPPPAKPARLSITLANASGALTLRWKAANPRGTNGTSYIIRRKLPGEAAFTFVGVSGVKRFTDNTFPAGLASVQYVVQGQRADRAGEESDPLVVNFGTSAAGETGANVSSASQPMRMAA